MPPIITRRNTKFQNGIEVRKQWKSAYKKHSTPGANVKSTARLVGHELLASAVQCSLAENNETINAYEPKHQWERIRWNLGWNITCRRFRRRLVLRACGYCEQTKNFCIENACQVNHHVLPNVQLCFYELYFLEADDETLLYYQTSDSLLALRLKISRAKKFCEHCTLSGV
jgi:hypothetical protein